MIRKTRPDNREKGVLLPVFSLPSPYGTGCFSEEARRFIDWLKDTGHTCWQILPLNPTGVADSPYQPLSSFAGNAYFIDPAQLVEQGLLSQEELEGFDFGDDPSKVDYDALFDSRMPMLRLAHSRFAAQRLEWAESAGRGDTSGCGETSGCGDLSGAADPLEEFVRENAFWLEDFALFMSLRDEFGKELSWDEWPEELRRRDPQAMARAAARHSTDVDFYRWCQYEFYRQWLDLKRYANQAGVKIVGDMPVYVSYDSSDCWADPDQFQLGEDLLPRVIAGVPPDAFAAEGQLWGNPLYDWEKMKKDGYRWWIRRIRQSFVLYDVIRLDHFRGYESYYSCDADAENAMHGVWHPGPGMDIFQRLEQQKDCFIAEDLGHLTPGVRQLLEDSGFPGMKVLQFAFDGDPRNPYLTENYAGPCVVYTGTHDNNTTAGWFRELEQNARAGILQYLGYTVEEAWWFVLESDAAHLRGEKLADPRDASLEHIAAEPPTCIAAEPLTCAAAEPREDSAAAASDIRIPAQPLNGRIPDPAIIATDLLIDKAFRSSAKLAVIPLQDYLHLGSEARVNVPGTVVDNWAWRYTP
ncbi:MAG: 4-alpha-glucanotransferase [Firmicutes bacterium]|nr:4-alpha-glucanotransferase [Bacillota bacterium]